MIHYIREHIRDGIDSDYPYCDIAWYFFRAHVLMKVPGYMVLWRKLHPGFPINNEEEMKIYQRYKRSFVGRWNHSACPVCKVKSYITGRLPVYYSCDKCDWQQLENKNCNKCK
jgi:hypothetical protein